MFSSVLTALFAREFYDRYACNFANSAPMPPYGMPWGMPWQQPPPQPLPPPVVDVCGATDFVTSFVFGVAVSLVVRVLLLLRVLS
jgi:hypothetical protein